MAEKKAAQAVQQMSKAERGAARAKELVKVKTLVRVLYRPPNSSYSNPILYEKGFGYVFCLSEILRKDYTER